MPKPIRIQKRLFTRGKTECLCCGHRFKFLLPIDILPFWDNLCSSCTLAMPEQEVMPGKIVREVMEWDL